MQTVGFWCDECRVKYVRHKCKDGLPCGHDKTQAVAVYAKGYGKGGEYIVMKWQTEIGQVGRAEFWVQERDRGGRVNYTGQAARLLWGHRVEGEDGVMPVGEWLNKQEGKVIRAFLERWQSRKEPPFWRIIETLPEDFIKWQKEQDAKKLEEELVDS